MVGVARRAWARNDHAVETVGTWNKANNDKQHITNPTALDYATSIDKLFE